MSDRTRVRDVGSVAPVTDDPGRSRGATDRLATGPLRLRGIPGADDAATRGVDEVLGREVGLVALPPAHGDALDDRIDGVRRLAGLHHPHLPEVLDVDGLEEGRESVLVLEAVPGTSLADLVAQDPLPLAAVAALGAQVAAALGHAHAHGVAHGRLGPTSVVVEGGHAVLVGLTDALRPGPARPPRRSADDDLRALGATLLDAVEPDGRAALARALTAPAPAHDPATDLATRLAALARASDGDDLAAVTARTAVAAPSSGSASGAGGAPPAARSRRFPALVGVAAAAAVLAGGMAIWGQVASSSSSVSEASEAGPVVDAPIVPSAPAGPAPDPGSGSSSGARSTSASDDTVDDGAGDGSTARAVTAGPATTAAELLAPSEPTPTAGTTTPTTPDPAPTTSPTTPTTPGPGADHVPDDPDDHGRGAHDVRIAVHRRRRDGPGRHRRRRRGGRRRHHDHRRSRRDDDRGDPEQRLSAALPPHALPGRAPRACARAPGGAPCRRAPAPSRAGEEDR